MMPPNSQELRVLGCLIEKQRTTPGAYPLSVNALRLACNQATNRDPVVDWDESTVRTAAQRLGERGWARFTSAAGSRAAKYRHVFDSALGLSPGDTALLAVLMLRGAQTPGELKTRTDRMHGFGSLAEVQETLEGLIGRELAAAQPRRPGQKEQRYVQLLGDEEEPVDEPPTAAAPDAASLEERVARLEAEVAALREELGG
ncbi:MAG: uncharacterized protein QOH58_1145 [Thermoleophilaceae bacterium]|jgi:uncharacterized protein YceH (UPF0502 family)|nr:uncharacterized protein [Thermoleophilaceae bacterium]